MAHFKNVEDLKQAYNNGSFKFNEEHSVNYNGINAIAKNIACSDIVTIKIDDERYASGVVAKITPDFGFEIVGEPTLIAYVPSEDDRGDMDTLGQGRCIDDDEYCY